MGIMVMAMMRGDEGWICVYKLHLNGSSSQNYMGDVF